MQVSASSARTGAPTPLLGPCAGSGTLRADVALTQLTSRAPWPAEGVALTQLTSRPRGPQSAWRGVLLWACRSSSVSPSIHTSSGEAAGCTSHTSLGNLSPVSRVSLQPCLPQQSSSLPLFQRSPCSCFQWHCNRPHWKGLFGRVSPGSLLRANPAFTSTQLRTFQVLPSSSTTTTAVFLGKVFAPVAPSAHAEVHRRPVGP